MIDFLTYLFSDKFKFLRASSLFLAGCFLSFNLPFSLIALGLSILFDILYAVCQVRQTRSMTNCLKDFSNSTKGLF